MPEPLPIVVATVIGICIGVTLMFAHTPEHVHEAQNSRRDSVKFSFNSDQSTKLSLEDAANPVLAVTIPSGKGLAIGEMEHRIQRLTRLHNEKLLSDEEFNAAKNADIGATTRTGPGAGIQRKYGFYLHVFKSAPAVIYQVRQIRKYFGDAPIYIMSDGGDSFHGLCQEYKCISKVCPPANDRWHPWPFFRRMYDAALALNTEYLIMLEPDNTIHREIRVEPDKDAGGLADMNPHFGTPIIDHCTAKAQKLKPGFKWEYTGSGLAGGSYFRTAAVLDAFSDEALAEMDWDFFLKHDSHRVFSSDFAMPLALSLRGYTYGPWKDIRQVDVGDIMSIQPKEAAFQHYGRGVPGGKPTYKLMIENHTDDALFEQPTKLYNYYKVTCHLCWNLTLYVQRYNTTDCASRIPFTYPEGKYIAPVEQKPPSLYPFAD